MSVRIVANLSLGLAEFAIDHGPDGGTWLSMKQGGESVIVKLSTPSLEALQLTLAKELGLPSGQSALPSGQAPARER